MMTSLSALKKKVRTKAKKDRAKTNAWFFKTGKGEYGEGDKFLGLTMPEQRAVARQFRDLSLKEVERLLKGVWHEERMIGLLILVHRYEAGTEVEKEKIFAYYIKHRHAVNNWDLVDVTTPSIIGDFLYTRNKDLLYTYARSKNLWERRIAIVATYPFIKRGLLQDTFRISKLLLNDTEDLIHKAVGWMLREVGKQDRKKLERFLTKHIQELPRTTLRYAIEHFPEEKRQEYLHK